MAPIALPRPGRLARAFGSEIQEAAGSGLAEAACAFGASVADGPVPSVSQAASASAVVNTARLTAVRIVRSIETETFIKAFQGDVF